MTMRAISWRSVVVAVVAVGTSTSALSGSTEAPHDEVEAGLREGIEAAFRAESGIGLRSFDCDIPRDIAPGQPFFCDAVGEEGDRFRYRIETSEEDVTVASVAQPAAQLEEETLAMLEAPCGDFLSRYRAGSWSELWADLDPDLQKEVSASGVEERLARVLDAMGSLRSFDPESFEADAEGRLQLVYGLESENGPGLARFGLAVEDDTARIRAFIVTAKPGSALQIEMAETVAREVLGRILERTVEGIEAPIERLRTIGDAVEGTARLAGGDVVPIRILQHGEWDDLDPMDFRVQVLDVPWLVARHIRSEGHEVAGVDCPSVVAPDGGRLRCVASLEAGPKLLVTIARRGGDHRILDAEEVAPDG